MLDRFSNSLHTASDWFVSFLETGRLLLLLLLSSPPPTHLAATTENSRSNSYHFKSCLFFTGSSRCTHNTSLKLVRTCWHDISVLRDHCRLIGCLSLSSGEYLSMSLTHYAHPLFSICLQLHTYLRIFLNWDITQWASDIHSHSSSTPQIIQMS